MFIAVFCCHLWSIRVSRKDAQQHGIYLFYIIKKQKSCQWHRLMHLLCKSNWSKFQSNLTYYIESITVIAHCKSSKLIYVKCKRNLHVLNSLTPVPPVTSSDEPGPFFHFWHHHFWPKLASSTLNFCKDKRSFQWCPDQSDCPNGAWDMHKNAQKLEWKTQSKISCHYTWLLHAKICPSRWRFLRSFLTANKPSGRSITAAKRKEKEKKERQKNKSKNRKAWRLTSLSKNIKMISAHARVTTW